MYTSEEKERIIRHFKRESQLNLEQIRLKANTLIQEAEQNVLRRVNTVSPTLWNVRIKDVLQIERHHKPVIRNLLRDVKALEENNSFHSDTQNSVFFTSTNQNVINKSSYSTRLETELSRSSSNSTTGKIKKSQSIRADRRSK